MSDPRLERVAADEAIHALAKGVAQATIERVWEELRRGTSMDYLMGVRHALADEMADITLACAAEDPESEVHALRATPSPEVVEALTKLEAEVPEGMTPETRVAACDGEGNWRSGIVFATTEIRRALSQLGGTER